MSLTMEFYALSTFLSSPLRDIENCVQQKCFTFKLLTIFEWLFFGREWDVEERTKIKNNKNKKLWKTKCFMVCYVIKKFLDWCLLNELKLIKPENLFSTYMSFLPHPKNFSFVKAFHLYIWRMLYTVVPSHTTSIHTHMY